MKNNGIIVAILDTPYVPMNGQDPAVYPYENRFKRPFTPTVTQIYIPVAIPTAQMVAP